MPLMSCAQLAREFKLTPQAISNWVRRRDYNGFPKPVSRGATGHKFGYRVTDLYDLDEVRRWRNTYHPPHDNGRIKHYDDVC